MKQIPFTQKGYDDMKSEQQRLQEKRKETVASLSRAREMGDLSENGLYKAAKMELGSIDRQLRRIAYLLRFAQIIEKQEGDIVHIGSTVTITDGKSKRELSIVGDFESDPLDNKISQKSPIGLALLGKKVGDEVVITIPSGKVAYTIQAIS
jgi:transcription elongation factor GreA